MVDFRLLGLVEVWSGNSRVPVGQPRQRLVLAALLVDAGRPVTLETLVERLWDDTPPGSARHAVHEYLTRIRRMLAELDGDRAALVRRGGAYVLDVDPELVDLHRFRRLAERARESDCTDAERAVVLGDALALWRGELLADLTGAWVQRVRESGRRQQLEAAVLWAETLSRLGRAAEVTDVLAELARQNPLSEPVATVLMKALHSVGRTAEALECYTAIRERLIAELGADPGIELQAVHQSILQDGPTYRTPPPVNAPEQPVVPAQLPAAVRGFVGRDEELARLDVMLTESQERGATVIICAVSGTAGIGKTGLAIHWAHRRADRFPDGQLYVNLQGFDAGGSAMTAAQAVRGFLDSLGVPPGRIPSDLVAQAGLYRSLLSGKRVLVVLDNARDADQVRPLLPGSPGCLVLVTSRSRLASLIAVDGAEPVALDVLSIEESRALLAQRLGPARIAAEPGAVDQVITRCARLPLALAVVAARAAVAPKTSLSTLAEQLRDTRDRLDELSAGDETSDVRAVFSWSYDALTPPAARMFRLLGLHPGPDISAAAAASLAGLPLADAAPLLAQLAGAHLLTEHRPGRYTFHDLLRASEQAHQVDSDQARHAAVRRTLDHYLHTAVAAVLLLNPHREPIALEPPESGTTPEAFTDLASTLAWFDTEHQVLLAAVDHAAATGFDAHTWQLAWYLVTHLRRRGHWDEWAATQRAAVAAADRLSDPATQTRAHRSLGDAYLALARFPEADEQLRAALDRSAQVGDLTQRARTHHRFAHLYEVQGQYHEALDHARQAYELDLTTGDRGRQAAALNSIGWFHALLGDYEQTVHYCRQAIAIHEELGEQDNLAGTLDSLAYAYHHLGEYAQATACYRRAIDLLHGLGDRFSEAATLNRLGDAHHDAGDRHLARTTYEHALQIFADLAHPDAEKVRQKLHDLAVEPQAGTAFPTG